MGERVYLQPVPSLEVVAKGTIVEVLDEELGGYITYATGTNQVGRLLDRHSYQVSASSSLGSTTRSPTTIPRPVMMYANGRVLAVESVCLQSVPFTGKTGPLRHADQPWHSDKRGSARA